MIKKILRKCFLNKSRISRRKKFLEIIENSDSYELQKEKLENLINFSKEKNPYYSEIFKKYLSFGNFPLLTKEIIKNNYDQLKSTDLKRNYQYQNSSGGSTGKPVTFFQDDIYNAWLEVTVEYYFKYFLSVDNIDNTKKVVLWGSERDVMNIKDLRAKFHFWLTNTVFLNTFNVTRKQWLEYIKKINSYKPLFIRGYAGSLYEIAKIIKEINIKVHKPKFIYSAAEMLQDFMRQTIEEAFGAKVYDFYGSREVGAIAGECSQGKKHIFIFNNLIEIFSLENKPLEKTREGKIIVTNLHNYSMPMIRFEIGDTGIINDKMCSCGSKLPYFEKITGRITDHFIKNDGTLVHGEYFTHLFYFKNWVQTFQVIQTNYDKIDILVEKNSPPLQNEINDIEEKIKIVMGQDCLINWKFVDKIENNLQGKHLFTKTLLKR